MRAKCIFSLILTVLSDIEEQNFHIHQDNDASSEDQLADSNIEEKEAMKQYADKDR